MRLTKSIKGHSSDSGQVSMEALLLWAGFAAVLSLLLPVFTGLVHAQSIRLDVENTRSFSYTLSSSLANLSFLSPGSRQTISIPLEENLFIRVEEEFVLLSYDAEGMHSPYVEKIESFVPLSYESLLDEHSMIILSRTSSGITIQYAETYLP